MRYYVEVKNRFTGKVKEVYPNMSINGVYRIQDEYLFSILTKVDVYPIGLYEWEKKKLEEEK